MCCRLEEAQSGSTMLQQENQELWQRVAQQGSELLATAEALARARGEGQAAKEVAQQVAEEKGLLQAELEDLASR